MTDPVRLMKNTTVISVDPSVADNWIAEGWKPEAEALADRAKLSSMRPVNEAAQAADDLGRKAQASFEDAKKLEAEAKKTEDPAAKADLQERAAREREKAKVLGDEAKEAGGKAESLKKAILDAQEDA